jgi:4-hydroxy-tetrahydrodipicolinate synthase
MHLSGSFVALVTPFTKGGRVDTKTLQELVRWHRKEGTEGIVCTGSTGEAITLSDKERLTVLHACLEASEKEIPIIAGTGTADTKQSFRLTEAAYRLGAHACMVVVPYYNKPTQRGCILHVRELSRIGVPLILYNNPGRCVIGLQPETIAELAQCPHVVALKEANNDLSHFTKIRSLVSIPLFAGEDLLTYEMLQAGAVGAISVIGNLFPKLWRNMVHAGRAKEGKMAKKLFDRVCPMLRALSLEPNPQCVKKALSLMGRCRATMRLPLVEPTEEVIRELKKAFFQLHVPFWGVTAPKAG